MSGPLRASDINFASKFDPKRSEFSAFADGRYRLDVESLGLSFEVDRLRLQSGEFRGELTVFCCLAGAPVVDGVLTACSFNLSYLGARRDQAVYISERAGLKGPETQSVRAALDELCLRVLSKEREGKGAVLLHLCERPAPDDVIDIEGITLPRRHPAMLFGDGAAGKSYLALLIAGTVARQYGVPVMYCDWELDERQHRGRLERLFGADMPAIHYVRCDRPMVAEADRLRRLVVKHAIEFGVFDSVAFACDGPPESAEAADDYCRSVRQLGPIGTLHLAHVTKPGADSKANEYKPFGSVFWFNQMRSCWFVKRSQPDGEHDSRVVVGLYHRKNNLGGLRPPVGLELAFGPDTTSVMARDLSGIDDLAAGVPVWRRLVPALKDGARTVAELVSETGAREDTIEKALKRTRAADKQPMFIPVTNTPDGVHRWGLAERRAS